MRVIDILDLTVEEINDLIDLAKDIMERPENYRDKLKGKILATLFFEPSTRTRLSFESAMEFLGGKVIGFSDKNTSSAKKGESLVDTVKTVSLYCDLIAMRSPLEGAALLGALNINIPVINAGDGGHKHPTQTLADLMTIKVNTGDFSNKTYGLCGDLKYGRTIHSLVLALSRYENVKFVFISPENLKIPDYLKDILKEKNIDFIERESLEENIEKLDILYMTRVQKERFDDLKEYESVKDAYILTKEKLENVRENMIIMHPLPRVNEISPQVDDLVYAKYFHQALFGKYMRMALIIRVLEKENVNKKNYEEKTELYKLDPKVRKKENRILLKNLITSEDLKNHNSLKCHNSKCVISNEKNVKDLFIKDIFGNIRCAYCENLIK